MLTTCCLSCSKATNERYIFFLHNRFLEEHDLNALHPEYGRTEYKEIISAFEKENFTVISEQRQGNVNAQDYITVIGTSKGGYIAQYVSTLAHNTQLNFVFIASFRTQDLENIPDINYCGNILNIYEKTDVYGVSAISRKETSTCTINHYKDIELNTGLRHGFLFKPLKVWIEPCIKWANSNYN
jgi:hypothetical protein